MGFEIKRVDVWVGELEDRPGALSSKLATVFMVGEADLDFVIARPLQDKPGHGMLYVAPLESEKQAQAAQDAGLHKSQSVYVLRLEGPDHPGLIAGIAGTLSQADINITGLSAAATKRNAIIYVRFVAKEDVTRAADVLRKHLG